VVDVEKGGRKNIRVIEKKIAEKPVAKTAITIAVTDISGEDGRRDDCCNVDSWAMSPNPAGARCMTSENQPVAARVALRRRGAVLLM